MTELNFVVYKSSRGGWVVKQEGALNVSMHMDTKPEAVKMGRALSIKRGGKLEIIDESFKNDDNDSNDLEKEVCYG